jgi:hypothetical protein
MPTLENCGEVDLPDMKRKYLPIQEYEGISPFFLRHSEILNNNFQK